MNVALHIVESSGAWRPRPNSSQIFRIEASGWPLDCPISLHFYHPHHRDHNSNDSEKDFEGHGVFLIFWWDGKMKYMMFKRCRRDPANLFQPLLQRITFISILGRPALCPCIFSNALSVAVILASTTTLFAMCTVGRHHVLKYVSNSNAN